MKSERWQQIEQLYHAALEREESHWAPFLEKACGGDEPLRKEVEGLLAHEQEAGDFMEAPIPEVAAKVLAEGQAQSVVGRQIGSYKILSLLGAGGMGQVYRASDTKLGRQVAIKVLPDLLARDPKRLARFEREAKLLAALNHPNIAAIYGLEESNGLRYLVLELVEGETLAERLAEGPLPVQEALRICSQIAEALEAAHEKGIIHRDLKPANIKVTPQDKVKVLDFGVAKTLAIDGSGADLGSSSTRTTAKTAAETAEGVILGTAAYMSPEQARSKTLDKRADIWSFGCVLYECLTGKRAFEGETVTETLPKVLENEPDWEELPGNTSWNIRSLLCRCLQKDPHLRFHDMADARIEIEATLAEPTSWHPLSIWLMAAAAILVIGTAVLFWYVSELGSTKDPSYAGAAVDNSVLLRRVWQGSEVDLSGAPSPDGRYLSYVDWDTGDLALYELVTGKKRRLTNKGSWFESDEWAYLSTISPEGKRVAYGWANEGGFYELRVIGLDGFNQRILYRDEDLWHIAPAAWSPDGEHILAKFQNRDGTLQIVLVSVANGSVRVLKRLGAGDGSPNVDLSPDGRYVVYDLPQTQRFSNRDIFLLTTDGAREIPLVQHPADDLVLGWAPDGKSFLFASDRTGTPGAWIIQLADGKPSGPPTLVKADTGRVQPLGFTQQGSFYYGTQTRRSEVYIASLDLPTGTLLSPPKPATQRFVGSNASPDWSPDGESLAYISRLGHGNRGILSLRSDKTGEERQLPLDLILRQDSRLRWSPDARSILVSSLLDKDHRGVYQVDIQTGKVTSLLEGERGEQFQLGDWSPDGGSFYYGRKGRIWVKDLETGKEKELYPGGRMPALSPDGRWLAFVSTGRMPKSTRAALKVIPATGGEPQELFTAAEGEGLGALAWTSEGRSVLFTTSIQQEPTTEFWQVPATGGEPLQLGFHTDGMVEDLRVHPDGRRIAFGVGQGDQEVWVLENFLP